MDTYPPEPPVEPPEPLPLPEYPELRNSTNIQGNVLAGFRKDRQRLFFVYFPDQAGGRAWLSELLPRIATTDQVATFNEQFSRARKGGGGDPEALSAVWVNVSLTAHGIRILAAADPFTSGSSNAFLNGAAASAAALGDAGASAPENWVFGRSDQAIDAVITVQADRETDFEVELARQDAMLAKHGMMIVFEQAGATLPGPRAGHEHFGFKDGISQPGVRGFDQPDPDVPDQVLGRAGTDLVNPGEFVLGYRGETEGTVHPLDWMLDGSFHVIRRLAQDVPGWWAQVERQVPVVAAPPIAVDPLAAKLVGRWRSGTPLALAPERDLRSGRDPAGDNDFGYADDPEGHMTPRFAHIRKVYPRDAQPPGEDESQRHRIMRRGIPFGLPFDPARGRGYGADSERGLVFGAFMASIEDQFEFLQMTWANNADFPAAADGADPVIGTDSDVTLKRDGAEDARLQFERFVKTEGSLYAFAPSLPTLLSLASGGL